MMHFTIQLVIEDEGGLETIEEVIQLDKEFNDDSMVGLSLLESKAMLKTLQKKIISCQAKKRLGHNNRCPCCNKKLKLKDYHSIQYRTVFGIVNLQSPRLFHCNCHEHKVKTLAR